MAEMTRNDRRTGQALIASLVLAAALIAGLVGGLVGARLTNGAAAPAVQAAPKAASVDWAQYGRNWETQYRAMYPTTTDTKWADYGAAWQRQYEQQHPR
jgi:uncharacterized membrane protein